MNDVPGTRTPDISVVLATYDRRHSLPRAIASALAQDGVRFEGINRVCVVAANAYGGQSSTPSTPQPKRGIAMGDE